MGGVGNIYKILGGKFEVIGALGKPRRRWKDSIKRTLRHC
jgi:hypothetical protein